MSFRVILWLLWLTLVTASARDLTFSWQPSATGNIATYRLKWLTSFLVTTKTFATVTNFPFQDAFAVRVSCMTSNGLESVDSYPVVVIAAAEKLSSVRFTGVATVPYNAWLEGTNDLMTPFSTIGLLGSFGIVADAPKRFYRVRLTQLSP